MLQFSRLRYLLSWPMPMKFKCTLGQRNMLVMAVTVRWLWKPFRLPQHLHWYNSAKRCWIFPPGILWDCFGFLDILGYEEMKLLNSFQESYCSPVCWTWTDLGGGGGEVSRQNIRKKIKCWMDNHIWHCLISTQKQTQKLILGPSPPKDQTTVP